TGPCCALVSFTSCVVFLFDCVLLFFFFFFFSSRRRHTRSDRDWSSDVCSSDLVFQRSSQSGLSSRLINWKRMPVGPPAVCGRIASIRHSRGCWASAGGWDFIQQLVKRQAARVRERRTVLGMRRSLSDCHPTHSGTSAIESSTTSA